MNKHLCDRCNQENEIWQECNFCPTCRAEFMAETEARKSAMRESYDEYWKKRLAY